LMSFSKMYELPAGHAPSPRRASSHEVTDLPECWHQRSRAHVFGFVRCPLRCSPLETPQATPRGSNHGVTRPAARLISNEISASSPRLWLLFRVSPIVTAGLRSPRQHGTEAPCRTLRAQPAPSEVPAPLPFPRHRERHGTGEFPHSPFRLRPQGFTPSRRLAPPAACWACFIPDPAMGFDPSRFVATR